MKDDQNTTVLTETYELLNELITVLGKFPRDQRFLLGDRIQNMVSDVLELLIEAFYLPRTQKAPHLQKVNITLEKLRYFIRLAHQRNYLSTGKYKQLSEHLNSIGRQVGGWLKKVR